MLASRLADSLTPKSLFFGCSPEELAEISSLGTIRKFNRDQALMLQGDEGDCLFFLLSGLVRVSMVAPNGREIVLDYGEAGAVLGEIAFLDGGERTASVHAIEPVEALCLSRSAFREILERHNGLALRLLQAMAHRLRQNNAVIEADRAYSSGPRLARFLLRLSIGGGQDNASIEGRLKLPLSQGELGNFAGMSREQINRQLSAWADAGIVELTNGRVTVMDRAALMDIAETV